VPALLAAGCVLAAACSAGPSHPGHDHGVVVADLPIPFSPVAAPGKPDIMAITVTAGERFSIKVDTSDGPFYWAQSGARPDPRLIRAAGDINDGHCAPGLVGCRVPYFHTLIARHAGTTTMTWAYHALGCPATPPPRSASPPCQRIALVTFKITIR